jgi:hypothetical protein
LIHSLLFQPGLSVAFALIALGLIVWPGYAILHLLGLGRHRWTASVFAGPAVTIALWIVTLSGAVWASIPLQRMCGPVWVASFFLTALGIGLRVSVRHRLSVDDRERWQFRLCWLVAFLVPIAAMPSTIQYGLGIYASSICQDAWNYIAAADYFSHYARGTEGSFSPVDQYGSYFMNSRNASSVLLAYFASGLRVTPAEVISLYCLLVLFANSCALTAFAATIFEEFWQITAFVLFAGFGIPLLIVTYANLDQMLLLPMLPLLGAMALKAGRGEGGVSLRIMIGILVAAAILAYIEMAILGLPIAAAFMVTPAQGRRLTFRRVIGCIVVAVSIAAVLAWPGLAPLTAFLKLQYSIASQAGVRPGDGALANWLVTGEFVHLRWFGALLVVVSIVAAITAGGVWFERRRWAVVAALFGLTSVVLYFMFYEKYPYAVYKVASVNFWMVSFFTIAGLGGCLKLLSRQSSLSIRWAHPVSLAVAGLSLLLVSVLLESRLTANAVNQKGYREAVVLAAIVGNTPTILSVRDEAANQWAVVYLASVPLLIRPYRSTMGQPELQPIMSRARTIDMASAQFVITDHDPAIRSTVKGAQLVWDGQTYSLWKLDRANWSVTADGGAFNDAVHLGNLAAR